MSKKIIDYKDVVTGRSLLFMSVACDAYNVVSFIIELCNALECSQISQFKNVLSPIINAYDNNGDTPILMALEHGYMTIVMLLVEAGVKLDLIDKHKRGCLEIAVLNNFESGLSYMLLAMELKNPLFRASFISNLGVHVLCLAIQAGYLDICNVLINYDVDISIDIPEIGSLLHVAARTGVYAIINLLLLRKIDVNKLDKYNKKASFWLPESNVLKLLMSAAEKNLYDPCLHPVHYAAMFGDIHFLKQSRSMYDYVYVKGTYDENGHSICCHAIQHGHFDILSELKSMSREASALYQHRPFGVCGSGDIFAVAVETRLNLVSCYTSMAPGRVLLSKCLAEFRSGSSIKLCFFGCCFDSDALTALEKILTSVNISIISIDFSATGLSKNCLFSLASLLKKAPFLNLAQLTLDHNFLDAASVWAIINLHESMPDISFKFNQLSLGDFQFLANNFHTFFLKIKNVRISFEEDDFPIVKLNEFLVANHIIPLTLLGKQSSGKTLLCQTILGRSNNSKVPIPTIGISSVTPSNCVVLNTGTQLESDFYLGSIVELAGHTENPENHNVYMHMLRIVTSIYSVKCHIFRYNSIADVEDIISLLKLMSVEHEHAMTKSNYDIVPTLIVVNVDTSSLLQEAILFEIEIRKKIEKMQLPGIFAEYVTVDVSSIKDVKKRLFPKLLQLWTCRGGAPLVSREYNDNIKNLMEYHPKIKISSLTALNGSDDLPFVTAFQLLENFPNWKCLNFDKMSKIGTAENVLMLTTLKELHTTGKIILLCNDISTFDVNVIVCVSPQIFFDLASLFFCNAKLQDNFFSVTAESQNRDIVFLQCINNMHTALNKKEALAFKEKGIIFDTYFQPLWSEKWHEKKKDENGNDEYHTVVMVHRLLSYLCLVDLAFPFVDIGYRMVQVPALFIDRLTGINLPKHTLHLRINSCNFIQFSKMQASVANLDMLQKKVFVKEFLSTNPNCLPLYSRKEIFLEGDTIHPALGGIFLKVEHFSSYISICAGQLTTSDRFFSSDIRNAENLFIGGIHAQNWSKAGDLIKYFCMKVIAPIIGFERFDALLAEELPIIITKNGTVSLKSVGQTPSMKMAPSLYPDIIPLWWPIIKEDWNCVGLKVRCGSPYTYLDLWQAFQNVKILLYNSAFVIENKSNVVFWPEGFLASGNLVYMLNHTDVASAEDTGSFGNMLVRAEITGDCFYSEKSCIHIFGVLKTVGSKLMLSVLAGLIKIVKETLLRFLESGCKINATKSIDFAIYNTVSLKENLISANHSVSTSNSIVQNLSQTLSILPVMFADNGDMQWDIKGNIGSDFIPHVYPDSSFLPTQWPVIFNKENICCLGMEISLDKDFFHMTCATEILDILRSRVILPEADEKLVCHWPEGFCCGSGALVDQVGLAAGSKTGASTFLRTEIPFGGVVINVFALYRGDVHKHEKKTEAWKIIGNVLNMIRCTIKTTFIKPIRARFFNTNDLCQVLYNTAKNCEKENSFFGIDTSNLPKRIIEEDVLQATAQHELSSDMHLYAPHLCPPGTSDIEEVIENQKWMAVLLEKNSEKEDIILDKILDVSAKGDAILEGQKILTEMLSSLQEEIQAVLVQTKNITEGLSEILGRVIEQSRKLDANSHAISTINTMIRQLYENSIPPFVCALPFPADKRNPFSALVNLTSITCKQATIHLMCEGSNFIALCFSPYN